MSKVFSLVLYVCGLGSLFLSDILITKYFPPDDIALWASVRSLIGIVGVFCLVGLDQVLVRSPQSSARLVKILSIQITLLSLVIGVAIWQFGFLDSLLSSILLGIGSAGSLALFQYFRSHHHKLKSQLAQQAWKILIFIGIIASITGLVEAALDKLTIGVLLFVVGISVLLTIKHPPSSLHIQNPERVGALYAIGIRFMGSSLLLALAIYAEQLVVNKMGTSAESSFYFTHAAYFLFPISFVNGYFAFLIGPWLRDNHDKFGYILKHKSLLICFGIISYCVTVNLVGYVGWIIISPTDGSPDKILQFIFFIVCIARSFYSLPSAYLGIYGSPRQHDSLIVWHGVGLACAIGMFIFLNTFQIILLIYAVAIASMINWIIRTIVGIRIGYSIFNSRVVKD